MIPQAYTEFQPLKEIIVGRSWSSKYINNLKQISETNKRLLTSLLDETEEDYQKLISILTEYGAKVLRPDYSYSDPDKIYDYPALMSPRDWSIVFDNDLILGNPGTFTTQQFALGVAEHAKYFKRPAQLLGFNPASIIRLGKDIIVDIQQYSNTETHYKYIRDTYEPRGFKVHGVKTHNTKFKNPMSHADATFAILKPGVILTTQDAREENEGLFKGWDVHVIEITKEQKVFNEGWVNYKTKRTNEGVKIIELSNGYKQNWATNFDFEHPQYNDKKFHEYIDNWLSNWLGYSSETVFDVKCLVLDESHVVFCSYNKGVFDFCKKHKIEPILCDWRHRWFWDGGLHCITVDTVREGACEQYL